MSFFKTVDIMANYTNTLGLVVANALLNGDDHISAVPVIKAVLRDLKRYMNLKNEGSDKGFCRFVIMRRRAAVRGT